MTVWIVLLTIGVLLFLLAMLRVGGIAEYSSQGLQLRLRIGWLKITLYPTAGGDKKAKQKEKKRKKAKTVQAESPEGEKKGGGLGLLKEFLPLACEAADSLFRKIRVDRLVLHLTWASDNPARTAMGFGAGNAILGMIWPLLDHNFTIREHDVGVAVDFESQEPSLYLYASLSMTVGQAVAFGIVYAYKALRVCLANRPEQRRASRQKTKTRAAREGTSKQKGMAS